MAVANLQLKPPDSFDFKQPDGWTKWKKRFERFRVASGLADESELKQVNTLLYCLGEEAEDVLTSTNITEYDKEKYNPVMAKFDEFFQVRKNVIFERARFNRRNKHEGESIEQYISQLYSLSESCDYGALKEEMLRDRIVVGIRDTSLSERLQMDDKLTLEKAKKMVRQKEAVSQHGQELRGDGSKRSPIVIERVEGGSPCVHAVASLDTTKETDVQPGMPLATSVTARVTTSNSASCKYCGHEATFDEVVHDRKLAKL